MRIGFDVGGTFTDLVLQRSDGELLSEKHLTRPDDLVSGITQGLAGLLSRAGPIEAPIDQLVHATTLCSNAVLERRGPKVALITTRGFRDVLQIQRSLRYSMYDVQIEKVRPLIPRSSIWEVTERGLADGTVLEPLDEAELRSIAGELRSQRFRAVAIAFLHAYSSPAHERRAREILNQEVPELLVTLSSEASLRSREYERTNTAVVNAYLAPLLDRYLRELGSGLPQLELDAPLWMMQSSGGLTPASDAIRFPVRTIESGPAAGVLMAAHYGGVVGAEDVISFDMGGTTAKAAVIRGGRPTTTRYFELERTEMRRGSGLPLDISAIDLVEVGTGGGSIAEASHGILKVGPRSAGAAPGPACYGRGGRQATVTDANLILGYLNPAYFAGGAISLDTDAAAAAIGELAGSLGLDLQRASWGIHEVANLEMEGALRRVSINRGVDPRDFVMVCFGGAAPAHGCRLARSLGIRRILIPPAAGVGSALGLLVAEQSLEIARTAIIRLDGDGSGRDSRSLLEQLEAEARALVGSSWGDDPLQVRRAVGMRFFGQAAELEVPLEGELDAGHVGRLTDAFHDRYERTYGYREEKLPVEAVTWFVTVTQALERAPDRPRPRPSDARGGRSREGERAAFFPEVGLVRTPVYDRTALTIDEELEGPCLIEEAHTTTVILPGARVRLNAAGMLDVEVGAGDGT